MAASEWTVVDEDSDEMVSEFNLEKTFFGFNFVEIKGGHGEFRTQ